MNQRSRGFTLIELLVAIGIVAVLASIALPLYNGYVQTSREGVLVNNISSMEIFQEDFRLRTGSYLLTAADTAAITAAIGWDPQDDAIDYSIADGGGGTYEVTAVDEAGVTVCLRLPPGDPC